MSRKTVIAFLTLFAAFASFAADDAASGKDAISLPPARRAVKEQSAAVKDTAVKRSDVKPAEKPAEKKKPAQTAGTPEKKKPAQTAGTPEKKKSADPAKGAGAKNDLALGDVTASLSAVTALLGGMTPMSMLGGGESLTKEDAVKAFHELLNAYRNASPEEKQQVVMAVAMMQGIISGLSMNAELLLQQVPSEERAQVVESASAALEIIAAVQKEISGEMTDEETVVFGGLFQSFRSLTSAFSKSEK